MIIKNEIQAVIAAIQIIPGTFTAAISNRSPTHASALGANFARTDYFDF